MKKLPVTNNIFHLLFSATLALPCGLAIAEEPAPKAVVALVGDTDKFNIGQGDFCDERSDISSPSGKQFRIPSSKKTFFYIRSKFYTPGVSHICEGDFSFIPAPGKLHIIRYTMGENCMLEVYQSEPGGEPHLMAVQREASQSCLFK